jgi:hypothetical protein
MNPAAAFGIESFATHPSREERGKGWGTVIVVGSERLGQHPIEC